MGISSLIETFPFPRGFVGGRPVNPTDSKAWPLALHTAQAPLSMGREAIAATSAHIPHLHLFLWDRRYCQLGLQCIKALSVVVLCISPVPSNITQISCSPICWLTSGENCQNQTENQHSVLHVQKMSTQSTDHCSTSYTCLVSSVQECFHQSQLIKSQSSLEDTSVLFSPY